MVSVTFALFCQHVLSHLLEEKELSGLSKKITENEKPYLWPCASLILLTCAPASPLEIWAILILPCPLSLDIVPNTFH